MDFNFRNIFPLSNPVPDADEPPPLLRHRVQAQAPQILNSHRQGPQEVNTIDPISIETTNPECRLFLKKLTNKRTWRQVFLYLRPPLLLGFCLEY
jgi:hypothetical protein